MTEDVFIHEQIENEELLKLMHQMRQERSQEKMLEVLRLAAVSSFIVPVDVSSDGRYGFHAVSDGKGRKFAVAYSDTGSFVTSEKSEDPKGVKASFEDLMELVLQDTLGLDGVIINPGASEVIFGKELMNSIKGQMGGDDTGALDMRVGTPSEYPPKLKEMIDSFCRDEKRISKVYVRLLTTEDGKTMKWLIGVECQAKGEELTYLLDTFKRYITPYLQGADVIVAGTDQEFVIQAIKNAEPFYERT